MARFLPTSETLDGPKDQLEAIYSEAVDRANKQNNVENSVNSAVAIATFVRGELHRRVIERNSTLIKRLTWAVTVFTAVNVVLVAVSLFL